MFKGATGSGTPSGSSSEREEISTLQTKSTISSDSVKPRRRIRDRLRDRGSHSLKRVPGQWHLFSTEIP
jgi:hypothetical protein